MPDELSYWMSIAKVLQIRNIGIWLNLIQDDTEVFITFLTMSVLQLKCNWIFLYLINIFSECFNKLEENSGYVTSNNYPDNYPNNMDCSWLLTAKPNERVQIKFEDFDVEKNKNCKYDYVGVSTFT